MLKCKFVSNHRYGIREKGTIPPVSYNQPLNAFRRTFRTDKRALIISLVLQYEIQVYG